MKRGFPRDSVIDVLVYKNGVMLNETNGYAAGQAFLRVEEMFVQNVKGDFCKLPSHWLIA